MKTIYDKICLIDDHDMRGELITIIDELKNEVSELDDAVNEIIKIVKDKNIKSKLKDISKKLY